MALQEMRREISLIHLLTGGKQISEPILLSTFEQLNYFSYSFITLCHDLNNDSSLDKILTVYQQFTDSLSDKMLPVYRQFIGKTLENSRIVIDGLLGKIFITA